jgi:predicted extracellular nuclease
MKRLFLALGVVALFAATAQAQMRITEWMYNGKLDGSGLGEFVEFTNMGSAAINMAGWSFDDNSHTPGSTSLSAFASVAPGESVILTDATAAAFRTAWGLSEAVKIIGGNSDNLGRSDEINLYDSSNSSIDQLTYNDQGTGTVKGPRTQYVSGNIPLVALGLHTASAAVLSAAGDTYGSWTATSGDIGNPGLYAVPEPASIVLALIALVGAACLRRWNKK